jgi:hypothetical protein
MTNEKDNLKTTPGEENTKPIPGTHKQEQSDPQLTELRGFTNSDEDLEPTLKDGTKSPDKAAENYQKDKKE